MRLKRMGSKTTQAYLDMRQKILVGEYATDEVLVPKQIEEAFHMNNTTTQILLMRLANEGLVKQGVRQMRILLM